MARLPGLLLTDDVAASIVSFAGRLAATANLDLPLRSIQSQVIHSERIG